MKKVKYTFDDLLNKVNRFVRNKMIPEEEATFIHDAQTDKKIGKIVATICVFIKENAQETEAKT